MAIDWSNEPYARLFKRETDDDLLLTWEARAVWHEFLKRCDASGLLTTKRGVQGVAALLRIPHEVVERVLQELIEDGRIRSVPNVGFVAPNYTEANFASRSDRARQAESRLRRRQDAVSAVSGDSLVRESHAVSHAVTSGHTESQPVTHNTHNITDHHQSASPPAGDGFRLESEPKQKGKRRTATEIPPDWQPGETERQLATELGLNCDQEAVEFQSYWLSEGKTKKDWNQAFRNRLYSQARRGGSSKGWRQNTPVAPQWKDEL
jgi:hypothetical protein